MTQVNFYIFFFICAFIVPLILLFANIICEKIKLHKLEIVADFLLTSWFIISGLSLGIAFIYKIYIFMTELTL